MSKDVRRLFAAQKAAKAAAGSPVSTGSGSPSLASSSKRVTHPLAKYDPKTFRLTCAICGPAQPIKSDSLWSAHLVSKAHQEAVAKLRAVKEQMQKREAEAAERLRLQQQQQQAQTQTQGTKRKASGGLVAYADNSESESDEDEKSKPMSKIPESKRAKVEDDTVDREQRQAVADIEEEEEVAMAGLPAGFFDSGAGPSADREGESGHDGAQEESMDGVLPAGFFDDPEQDARVRTEVGGATADQQQRQVDEEFRALQAELARDLERQEQQEQALRLRQASGVSASSNAAATNGAAAATDQIPYEEKVELEEQELEESILARSEEEYQLFIEMQERLDGLREKKSRLLANQQYVSAPSPSSRSVSDSAVSKSTSKAGKQKGKSILDVVREQEKAKKEKERLAAKEFAKLVAAGQDDSTMVSDDEKSGEDDDEDIEAMMDWRARRF
ncbi:hypothetical protein BGZ54_007428 [Gamsiella multidivaricata]|nr:hypothetical protein BGZ54_007428 [Gamsiella multidivaricata]